MTIPNDYDQVFSCVIPKVVGLSSQLGGDSSGSSAGQFSASVEVTDDGSIETENIDQNGVSIIIPKQSQIYSIVDNKTIITSNEVSSTDTVAVKIENTVSFEFDIQPEFYLTSLFNAGQNASRDDYTQAMEAELCA